jgi:hypothetical protein
MVMITRSEFITWWNDQLPKNPVDDLEHVLWIPETQIVPGPPSEWFIKMPITTDDDFWDWCRSSLRGIVRCYSCDNDGGLWWGFTNKQDIVVFILRWS